MGEPITVAVSTEDTLSICWKTFKLTSLKNSRWIAFDAEPYFEVFAM